LQVHICKFVQVCKFTKLKNLESHKLIITILQVYKLQVRICKFVQVCKFTKSRNCKLVITNQNHHITKLPNIKLQSYKLHMLVYKFQIYNVLKKKLQLHVCKYTKLP